MVRLVRNGVHNTGMVVANGGYMTYHHAVCLSRYAPDPLKPGYAETVPLPSILNDIPVPDFEHKPNGVALIEVFRICFPVSKSLHGLNSE